jgi:hypothetical protein
LFKLPPPAIGNDVQVNFALVVVVESHSKPFRDKCLTFGVTRLA